MAKNAKVAKKRGRAAVAHAFPAAGTTLVGRYHGRSTAPRSWNGTAARW